MASFRSSGLDELIDDLAQMGETTGELAEEMLFAGAKEIKEGWKAAIKKAGHIDTGQMMASVDHTKTVKKTGEARSLTIYPQGKDKKGMKNAAKAFLNHYGTKKKRGTHFVDDAEEIAVPKLESKLLRIYDAWLLKHKMK